MAGTELLHCLGRLIVLHVHAIFYCLLLVNIVPLSIKPLLDVQNINAQFCCKQTATYQFQTESYE